MDKKQILEQIEKLKGDKRNFSQSIDLVITLKGIDVKKESYESFVTFSNQIKKKRVCLFADKSIPGTNEIFDTIVTKDKFKTYDKKNSKKLIKDHDFFVAQASVMADVAASFGRLLGPAGKMPSPAIGSVITKLDSKSLNEVVNKLSSTVKIKTGKRDSSLKLSVGNQKMENEKIFDNIISTEESLLKVLPKGKENLKHIIIKTTMGKPEKLD